MSQLQVVNQQIQDLLNGCLNEGLLDDQFMQLMQLQVWLPSFMLAQLFDLTLAEPMLLTMKSLCYCTF